MGREAAVFIHQVLVDQFIASFAEPPEALILDFDATDDRVHGLQEGRFFHGYYDAYCFRSLYVFCGDQLLVSYLRPSKIDGAKHAWAILALLVSSGCDRPGRPCGSFCGPAPASAVTACCAGAIYIVGLARNQRLQRLIKADFAKVEQRFQATGEKQRHFIDLRYSAKSWGRCRAVIAKREVTMQGRNPRFIVTNLNGNAQQLYDQVYCARDEMENRIKEQQLGLFADRTSAHQWWTNQFRLLLSSLAAYVLMETIRRLALHDTEPAHAQVGTLRLKLLKIGAIILRNTRRIRFLLSSAFPYQNLFYSAAKRLVPG